MKVTTTITVISIIIIILWLIITFSPFVPIKWKRYLTLGIIVSPIPPLP
jgi:hypothetical protein